MNWKIIFVGGLAWYAAQFVVSLILGFVIHSPESGVLADAYRATASFWRPELNANPPDAGLFWSLWIPSGLLGAFLAAGAYGVIRPALTGPGWRRGLKFGVIALVFAVINALGYNGVFDLPAEIWIWWMLGAAILYLVAGPVLGWIADKLAPPAPARGG
jgi:hypothetical protein